MKTSDGRKSPALIYGEGGTKIILAERFYGKMYPTLLVQDHPPQKDKDIQW